MSAKLRVPAVSRLQKLHNVELALDALRTCDPPLQFAATKKDVVDGNREKTLGLLWTMILRWKLAITRNTNLVVPTIMEAKLTRNERHDFNTLQPFKVYMRHLGCLFTPWMTCCIRWYESLTVDLLIVDHHGFH